MKAELMTGNSAGKSRSLVRRWAPLAVLLAILVVGWFNGWHEFFSLSKMIQHRDTLAGMVADNIFLASFAFIGIYAVLVGISFPGASYLTISSGLLFGGLTVGATIGAVIIFLIARSSFGDFLEAKAGPFVTRMVGGFQKDAFQYLLTLRLTPVFPFWVVNIVPALLNMKLLPYAVATFFGIIPGGLAFAYIGAGLNSIIEAQQLANPGCAEAGTCSIDPGALVTTEILIAMGALAAISILPLLVRKLRAGKSGADDNPPSS